MTIKTMRAIDRFLGVPLCWILGSILVFVDRIRGRSTDFEVRNILVIKFFGMGSILLATPALQLLRSAYPTSTISVLSFENNRPLLDRLPVVDQVLSISTTSIGLFLADTLRLVVRCFRFPVDVVFDFEFFSKFSTLITATCGARERIGFALPARWRSMILTRQRVLAKTQHVSESFCDLVRSFTGCSDTTPSVIAPTITSFDRQGLLDKYPIEDHEVVCVNVNAGPAFLERRWPADRFAALVSRMSEEDDSLFCFVGNDKEYNYAGAVIADTLYPQRCLNLCGGLTIPELSALLERSRLLISNDSGPLHLAAALGTPTVGLYGPENPIFYGTQYGGGTTLYKHLSCSPCMNVYAAKYFRCPYSARCMREISVDEVFDSIQLLVQVL